MAEKESEEKKRSRMITSRMVARQLFTKSMATNVRELLADIEVKLADDLYDVLVRLTEKEVKDAIVGDYTTSRLKSMIDMIRDFSNDWTQVCKDVLEEGAMSLIEAELNFEKRFIKRFSPHAGDVVGKIDSFITPRQVLVAAKKQPMDSKLMKEVFPEMKASVKRNITKSLRESFVTGESVPQAIKNLREHGIKGNRAGAEMLVRTGLAHYSFHAARESMAALFVNKVVWVSTLDSRTSTQCRALDGTVWLTTDEKMPPIPRHPNCRSAIAPLFDDETADDITGERASKGADGGKPVPASMNYEEWLREQPDSYAREILGPTQYKIWKTGVPVSKFTDKYATRAYTAEELKKKYASIFEEKPKKKVVKVEPKKAAPKKATSKKKKLLSGMPKPTPKPTGAAKFNKKQLAYLKSKGLSDELIEKTWMSPKLIDEIIAQNEKADIKEGKPIKDVVADLAKPPSEKYTKEQLAWIKKKGLKMEDIEKTNMTPDMIDGAIKIDKIFEKEEKDQLKSFADVVEKDSKELKKKTTPTAKEVKWLVKDLGLESSTNLLKVWEKMTPEERIAEKERAQTGLTSFTGKLVFKMPSEDKIDDEVLKRLNWTASAIESQKQENLYKGTATERAYEKEKQKYLDELKAKAAELNTRLPLKVDDEEKIVLELYQGHGYRNVNRVLRNPEKYSQEQIDNAKIFSNQIEEVVRKTEPLPNKLIVYRGLKDERLYKEIENHIGESVRNKTLQSTSLEFNQALDFSGLDYPPNQYGSVEPDAIVLEITIPAGEHALTPADWLGRHRNEQEVILIGEGSEYKIISTEIRTNRDGGTYKLVKVEYRGKGE